MKFTKYKVAIIVFLLVSVTFVSFPFASCATITDVIGNTDGYSDSWLGYMAYDPITASASGTLTTIGVNVAVATGNMRIAIYSTLTGSNELTGLMWQSSSTVSVSGWNNFTTTSQTITSEHTYYLAIQSDDNSNGYAIYSTSGYNYYAGFDYGTFPATTPAFASEGGTFNMLIKYSSGASYSYSNSDRLNATHTSSIGIEKGFSHSGTGVASDLTSSVFQLASALFNYNFALYALSTISNLIARGLDSGYSTSTSATLSSSKITGIETQNSFVGLSTYSSYSTSSNALGYTHITSGQVSSNSTTGNENSFSTSEGGSVISYLLSNTAILFSNFLQSLMLENNNVGNEFGYQSVENITAIHVSLFGVEVAFLQNDNGSIYDNGILVGSITNFMFSLYDIFAGSSSWWAWSGIASLPTTTSPTPTTGNFNITWLVIFLVLGLIFGLMFALLYRSRRKGDKQNVV